MPMFSFTLVQKIEGSAEEISGRVADEVKRDPHLPAVKALGRDEIAGRARGLIENLGVWLTARDAEVQNWSEPLGRKRFEQSIPVHELVRSLQILEGGIIAFARDHMPGSALQIYAEEELQYRVNRFFNQVIFYVVRGYESALKEALAGNGLAASAAKGSS